MNDHPRNDPENHNQYQEEIKRLKSKKQYQKLKQEVEPSVFKQIFDEVKDIFIDKKKSRRGKK